MSSPKVLLVDIETFPNLGYSWGKWDQNILEFVKEWELASFAWKQLGIGKVEVLSRPQFKDKTDAALTRAVYKVLETADIVIGHNAAKFDSPKLKAKFVALGLRPLSYKVVDTCLIARSQFGFNSNKLEDLAKTLGLGRKVPTGGFELWLKCMAGDRAAWKKMVKYNAFDVTLLERVYEKFKAWYPSHPNFALYSGEGDRPECPVCESLNVQRRGYHVMIKRRAARYHCQKCGSWFQISIGKATHWERMQRSGK
jgi:hypothetical protein